MAIPKTAADVRAQRAQEGHGDALTLARQRMQQGLITPQQAYKALQSNPEAQAQFLLEMPEATMTNLGGTPEQFGTAQALPTSKAGAMPSGLFLNEKQLIDQQYAQDAAGGSGQAAGFFSQLGGDLGRNMSGNVDPRIALAQGMAGLDMATREGTAEAAKLASSLGLTEQGIALADRWRSMQPEASKPFVPEYKTVNNTLQRTNEDGTVSQVADLRDPEEAPDTFTDETITLADGTVAVIARDDKTNKPTLITKSSQVKDGNGGSGSSSSNRAKGFEAGQVGQRLKGRKGFGDLNDEQLGKAGTAIAPLLTDLRQIGGISESAQFDLAAIEMGKSSIPKAGTFNLLDWGDGNAIDPAAMDTTMKNIAATEQTIKRWHEKYPKALRQDIIDNLAEAGQVDQYYGRELPEEE